MAIVDKQPFWRKDTAAVLLAILAVLLMFYGTRIIENIERKYYDFANTQIASERSEEVAVIAIDEESIENLGRWPWRRDVHAQMVDVLSDAGAKVIGYQVFFTEPNTNDSLPYLQKIDELAQLSEDVGNAASIQGVVREAKQSLDDDSALSAALGRAANVVLPAVVTLGEPVGNVDQALPDYVLKSTVDDPFNWSNPAVEVLPPIQPLAEPALGVAHLTAGVDMMDGVARYDIPLVGYYGDALPSMPVQLVSQYLNLKPSDVAIDEGFVQIGNANYSTNEYGLILPVFQSKVDDAPSYTQDSFYDVLTGKLNTKKYKNKIVVVGPTAAGIEQSLRIPGTGENVASVEYVSEVTSALLSQHTVTEPAWAGWITALLFLCVAAYLLWGLPKLKPLVAAVVSLALFAGLLLAEFLGLTLAKTWVALVLPALLLLTGYLVLTTKRFLVAEEQQVFANEQSSEANRMMGVTLQSQGRLDEAFDRFRKAKPDEALMDNVYSLALDFERKRQFSKSQMAYEFIAKYDADYKDIQKKINRAKSLTETSLLGLANAHAGGTMVLDTKENDDGSIEKPMLGRYQVERELGKGAMGVVYLGKDPKIGREVAIKTLALNTEFDGEELDDARARFFREAESAGRLQHPNIVTIYDAGEEHDLAYIAMEFLHGSDLEYATKADALLPVDTVLRICRRVAMALAYAHKEGVIHRDIKPANIMYDPATDGLKVTDFGIARIVGSSKTKTGMVLGTPSFMSPELIAGKPIDGRTDIYSLGVMLHQLLCGQLPFVGESLATLMYKITNEPPENILQIRQDLPVALLPVLEKSMEKNPDARYQDGLAFADALDKVSVAMEAGTSPLASEAPEFVASASSKAADGDSSVDIDLGL